MTDTSPLLQTLLPHVAAPFRDELTGFYTRFAECAGGDIEAIHASLTNEQKKQWAKIWSFSPFVADYCARHPHFFLQLLSDVHLPVDRERLRAELHEQLTSCEDESLAMKVIRHFRHRMMCRVIWRDFLRLASMEETVQTMSDLADVCIDEALNWLYPVCCRLWGTPMYRDAQGNTVPQNLVVIGMGKLGAHELNVSSDVDLIFSFPENGETQGDGKTLEIQQFFIRLGQKLITLLDKKTEDGFVFRVDMRLRPYGQSGALALSFPAMEAYYQDQGREWERYAMIKARVVAGDIAQGEQLLRGLRPFVYRKYIDFSVVESLRDMKRMIAREVQRKGMESNVKLGEGGIREIEFIVQVFQLIRGGRDKRLQERSLGKVLPALAETGLLPAEAVDELWQAYRFLRNVEHAIQGMRDQQSQMLPEDPLNQLRVALIMGFADWDGFKAELDRQRCRVASHFSTVIADSTGNASASDDALAGWCDLWGTPIETQNRVELLRQLEVAEADRVASLLDAFEHNKAYIMMQSLGKSRMDRLMPLLLREIAQTEHPGQTLERVLKLVTAVLRRTAYIVLLYENPVALRQLVRLCAASPWIAEQLASTPILLDELINTNTLYAPPDKQTLRADLHQQLLRIPEDDEEELMEALRLFKKAHVLRVAASEVAGTLPLMKVSDYLTWIAEVMVERVVQMAWNRLTEKYGRPMRAPGEPSEMDFLVIGYGKLGGIELSYNSDLDLVFMHDVPVSLSTDGERVVDNGVFFTRMGQKIIHILNAQMTAGQLYEVDMRLRPSGNAGLLVTTPSAFEKYQMESAWTWEHQALIRARPIAGSEALAKKFERIRKRVISSPRDKARLQADVRSMRMKMQQSLGSPEAKRQSQFHIKHDPGGIVDIEFIVQYCVLAFSHAFPSLTQWSDNVRLLETLGETGILPAEDVEQLKSAYLLLRSMVHKSALQNRSSVVAPDVASEQRSHVIQVWQRLLGGDDDSQGGTER